MLARDDTPAQAPAADPAADAKALLAETPKNDVDLATWLLKAVDQGFATLWKDTRTELEDLRDGKKTDKGATPSTSDVKVSGLLTMYDVVKGPMQRWAADPKAKKAPVALGSFIRDAAGPHGGAAIDLPRVMGAGTAAEVVQMLSDLSVSGYGIGLPFSGDYFDPADELAAKQAAAKDAAGDDEPKPVTGALTLDAAHIYGCEWDAAAKAWKKPTVEQAGQAYTTLKTRRSRTSWRGCARRAQSSRFSPTARATCTSTGADLTEPAPRRFIRIARRRDPTPTPTGS